MEMLATFAIYGSTLTLINTSLYKQTKYYFQKIYAIYGSTFTLMNTNLYTQMNYYFQKTYA